MRGAREERTEPYELYGEGGARPKSLERKRLEIGSTLWGGTSNKADKLFWRVL